MPTTTQAFARLRRSRAAKPALIALIASQFLLGAWIDRNILTQAAQATGETARITRRAIPVFATYLRLKAEGKV